MEVMLLNGSGSTIKKPLPHAKCSHPMTTSKSSGEGVAKQDSEKCNHFSIRSLVSEVRKRNAKICWPFSTPIHTSKECCPALPPLPVKQYKRWNCQGCQRGTLVAEVLENGEKKSNCDDRMKDKSCLLEDSRACRYTATKSPVRLPQQLDEKDPEDILVQEDNPIHMNYAGRFPSSCIHNPSDKSHTAGLITGIRVADGGSNGSKGNQNLMMDPHSVAEKVETDQIGCTGEKRKRNTVVGTNSSEVDHLSEDTRKNLSSNWDRTVLVHQTGDTGASARSMSLTVAVADREHEQGHRKIDEMKALNGVSSKYNFPPGVNTAVGKDRGLHDSLMDLSPHNLNGLEDHVDEASDVNLLTGYDDPDSLTERIWSKKPPKIRKLDDIMKSEGMPNDNYISSKNAAVDGGSRRTETSAASNLNNEPPVHVYHSIETTEAKPVKRKNGAIRKKGKETFLIHLLKTVRTKSSSQKKEGDTRHINAREDTCISASLKDPDLNLEVTGGRENNMVASRAKKRSALPEVKVMDSSLMPQEDNIAQKGNTLSKDLQTGNSRSRSKGVILTERDQQCNREAHDGIQKEAQLSNKKKRSIVGDGPSQQLFQQSSKHSLSIKKQTVHQEVREVKKQKTVYTSEQEDDIPMDIVVLLATKQQEKHVANDKSDTANMSKFSETKEILKDGNEWGDAAAQASRSSYASDRCQIEEPQPSCTGNGAWSSVRNFGDVECRSVTNHSFSRGKQHHQFDLNQAAPVYSSAELEGLSPYTGTGPPVGGAQLSDIGYGRNYPSQRLSSNGMKLVAFCSNHIDKSTTPQDDLRDAYERSSGVLNGYPSRLGTYRPSPTLSYGTVHPGASQNVAAYNADLQRLASSRGGIAGWRGTWMGKSFAEPGNGYYLKKVLPVDARSHETISASSLLNLMQQSALSDDPHHSSIQGNNLGNSWAFNNGHGSDFYGSTVGIRFPQIPSGATSNPEQTDKAASLCKPLRPQPRIGVLGPLLQKEVINSPDDRRPVLGLRAANCTEMAFQKTNFLTRHSCGLSSEDVFQNEKTQASSFATDRAVVKPTLMSPNGIFPGTDSSVGSPAITGFSPRNNKIGQVGMKSWDGAFQPVRRTYKMEECVVNRNPADFAMPDEDSEYMVGYHDRTTEEEASFPGLQSQAPLHCQKGMKTRKLNDINWPMTNNRPPLSRLSYPQKAN